MRNWIVRSLSVVFAMTFMGTMFGSGIASAKGPALEGKTYSEAAAIIARNNGTPVIATVSGSELAMDDCIVVSYHKSSFLNSRGRNDRKNNFLLNMNCNRRVAGAGHSGNSAMSPDGAKAKEEQKTATYIAKKLEQNPGYCAETEGRLKWCQQLCKRTGLCEV
jgi:hypothetical protein